LLTVAHITAQRRQSTGSNNTCATVASAAAAAIAELIVHRRAPPTKQMTTFAYGGPQVTTFAQSSHTTTTPERLHNDSTATPQLKKIVEWLWCNLIGQRLSLVGHRIRGCWTPNPDDAGKVVFI